MPIPVSYTHLITDHPDIDGILQGLSEQSLEKVAASMGNVLERVTVSYTHLAWAQELTRIYGELSESGCSERVQSAPCSITCGMKECPSTLAPLIGTNKKSFPAFRLSMVTPDTSLVSSDGSP